MVPETRSWLPAFLGVSLAWGGSFLCIKWSLIFLTPFGVAYVGCTLGAITLIIIARSQRVALPRGRVVWLRLWVVSLCINVIPALLFALAETRTTSILASIINAITPLTTLFFLMLVFREEPVTRHQVEGLFVGMVGVLVVLGVWRGFGDNAWWAVSALLVAVVLIGVSYPYARRYLTPLGLAPVSLAAGQQVLSSLTLLITFLANGFNGHHVTASGVVGVLALGIFANGLAFMWNFRLIETVGSSTASTVSYFTPLVAVAAGVAFLHEALVWYEPVGGVVILVGAALGQGRLRRRRSASASSNITVP
jgi:drug/metabolite transporter (DMT)-like permease